MPATSPFQPYLRKLVEGFLHRLQWLAYTKRKVATMYYHLAFLLVSKPVLRLFQISSLDSFYHSPSTGTNQFSTNSARCAESSVEVCTIPSIKWIEE